MIQGLWEAGQLSMIHTYCRQDVIQTYGLFLRIELMRGRLPGGVSRPGTRPPLSRRALRDAWESPDSGERRGHVGNAGGDRQGCTAGTRIMTSASIGLDLKPRPVYD